MTRNQGRKKQKRLILLSTIAAGMKLLIMIPAVVGFVAVDEGVEEPSPPFKQET
jgi:hypothetical protein